MPEDRRGAYRRNAFTFGAVLLDGAEVGCLVWDVTDGGALIEFEGAFDPPDRITVRLAPDTEARQASVAWRRGNRAGLSFVA